MVRRLHLLPVHPDHYATLYAWRSDRDDVAYNPLMPIDEKRFAERMAGASGELSSIYDFRELKWEAVIDEEPAALVGIQEINSMMKTAEISYQVAPAMRGRGVGKAAVAALVEMLFSSTDLRKLCAIVCSRNLPSIRLLQALGFTREGCLRSHFLINGKPEDEIFFGILRQEWLEIRERHIESPHVR
ncbi:GNAT family N-acetyltransferase [Sediminispirochaeta bajacaliforniensis]|uniref:GNAT family N-acetyltransferase n=1 Tax=Sediminispirochaeta bajacaliforniensis TaxID=148 RepID=UPI0009D9C247|nr:GNAT family protein [Sediminispirochaeta bajacaliforniensis]